ncbi:MAG: efflux transporter outer membrane subunit [Akkermansiaceae bacterium]
MTVVSSCSNMPLQPKAKATDANQTIAVPSQFDASPQPVPEVASGLKSLFSDSRLNGYVDKALYSNPDLQTSLAKLEEAGFNTRKAYAPGLPSLSASAALGRTRSSGSNTGVYSASLDAQWEVDVWGRIRAGVDAASRDQAALAADHEASRQSIAAQTMQAYFSLIASEKLLDLSQRRLVSFEQTVKLVNRRFEAGTGELSDLDLARTDVENTRAQVEERKDSRDQAARQLAALTGSYPSAGASVRSYPSLRRSVPAGVPSSVMLKRPDIHAAYTRILAADSRVTVAHRDLYPSFPLTASAGQSSNVLKSLADTNFSVWSIAGNLTAPIIDGGSRRSELGAANARAKQALTTYRSTVLAAFQEVENALGSEYYLQRQESSYTSALSAARSAEERTQKNYEKGLVEILTFLDAQRRSFTTEESLINTKALRYQNRVSLALALGKGL